MKIIFATLLICTFVTCVSLSHPRDQVLEASLRSNESAFNELVQMLNVDSDLARINKDFTFLTSGADAKLPPDRLENYRRLFSELGLELGAHRIGNTIRLIVSFRGNFLVGYSEKSYVYSEADLLPLVTSLDYAVPQKGPVYKKVKGPWYLSLDRW